MVILTATHIIDNISPRGQSAKACAKFDTSIYVSVWDNAGLKSKNYILQTVFNTPVG